MEEVIEIFKDYKPIKCVYENENDFICIPETGKSEPLAVYYDKKLGSYKEVYFFQDMRGNIVEDIETSNLVYGKPMNYSDEF